MAEKNFRSWPAQRMTARSADRRVVLPERHGAVAAILVLDDATMSRTVRASPQDLLDTRNQRGNWPDGESALDETGCELLGGHAIGMPAQDRVDLRLGREHGIRQVGDGREDRIVVM